MLRSETVRAAALGVPAQCGGRGSSCSLVTCQRPLGLEHVPALETRSPPPPPWPGSASASAEVLMAAASPVVADHCVAFWSFPP